MVKSLLLGAAAGFVAVAGAQAADLPVKARPVQYVKICSLYGAGFFYIPGTDTCIKIGGFVRAEVDLLSQGSFAVMNTGDFNNNSNGEMSTWRSRAGVTFDARSQTEYGTLRSYAILATTSTNSQGGGNGGANGLGAGNPNGAGSEPYTRLWSNAAFIQLAGFTAGKTGSFFDFDLQPYSNQTNFWGSNMFGGGLEVFGYTAQFGSGLSASLSIEDPNGHRTNIFSNFASAATATPAGTPQYGNQQVPDIDANLRIDQAWGSAQVMGAYHQLTANSTNTSAGAQLTDSGYAFGAGLKINLPMLGTGDYIIAQATYANGAMQYAGSNINGGFALTSGSTVSVAAASNNYFGQEDDATVVGAGLDKTKAWSVTGGFEHFWTPMWKTSLYGAYGQLRYSAAASAVLAPATALAGSSANWSYTQVGSRTTWTPVANLDLSLEAMYNHLNGAYATGTANYGNRDWASGIFRVQRNFWP
jgi:hypothetical protein